jgi:hypothetical protein
VTGSARQPFPSLAINMNSPSTLLHWSIFQVTVANLVLIAVMVGIFGAALLLPFPRGRPDELAAATGSATDDVGQDGTAGAGDSGAGSDAGMWTARLRRRALRALPPGKLLPDSQPAYLAPLARASVRLRRRIRPREHRERRLTVVTAREHIVPRGMIPSLIAARATQRVTHLLGCGRLHEILGLTPV